MGKSITLCEEHTNNKVPKLEVHQNKYKVLFNV